MPPIGFDLVRQSIIDGKNVSDREPSHVKLGSLSPQTASRALLAPASAESIKRQTTNLGGRSSNLFGRVIQYKTTNIPVRGLLQACWMSLLPINPDGLVIAFDGIDDRADVALALPRKFARRCGRKGRNNSPGGFRQMTNPNERLRQLSTTPRRGTIRSLYAAIAA